MNSFALYLIQSSFALLIFWMFYHIALRNGTFFRLNRKYIMVSLIVSMVLPFLAKISLLPKISDIQNTYAYVLDEVLISEKSAFWNIKSQIPFLEILQAIYYSGVCLFLFIFLRKLFSLLILVFQGSVSYEGKLVYIKLNKDISPFSFFNLVFIGSSCEDQFSIMLAHEKVHIKQLHSLDIVFIELVHILFWFNPILYLLKKEIKETHEYLADSEVLEQGFDAAEYKLLVVKQALGFDVGVASAFNQSLIKKRIIMLAKQKTSKRNLLKLIVLIPASAILLFLYSSCSKTDSQKADEATQLKSTETKENPVNNSIKPTDFPGAYLIVEQMPEYPGGQKELQNFLATNIKYPIEAKEKKIQGKVYVRFVVTKEGTVSNISIAKKVDPILEAEAIRVVSLMEKWTPGKQKGQNVDVWFTIPINFVLQ